MGIKVTPYVNKRHRLRFPLQLIFLSVLISFTFTLPLLRLLGLSCYPSANFQTTRLDSIVLDQVALVSNQSSTSVGRRTFPDHEASIGHSEQPTGAVAENFSNGPKTTTLGLLGVVRSDWGSDISKSHPFCTKMKSKPVLAQAPLCKRDEHMLCKEGPQKGQIPFFSQVGQDYYVYTRHFKYLTSRAGVYLEAGTRHPVTGSNSFFMDACLRWEGICVEGSPNTLAYIHRARSCEVVPTCVTQHDGARRAFVLKGATGGELEDETDTNRSAEQGISLKIPCLSLQAIFNRRNVTKLDFLSLDVDGHELDVLKGIDFKQSIVNVMTVSTMDETLSHIQAYLEAYGYVRHMPDLDSESNHTGLLRNDAIFLHGSVRWGHPV